MGRLEYFWKNFNSVNKGLILKNSTKDHLFEKHTFFTLLNQRPKIIYLKTNTFLRYFRYVGGFLWLDKLGQAALYNYQVIIRQTFYHGCYALLGEDLLPNPDFWISALYKKLVSTKVCTLYSMVPNKRFGTFFVLDKKSHYTLF